MTQHACFCFLVALSTPMFASCQQKLEPAAILQRAIKAHGGVENLNKPRTGFVKGLSEKVRDSEMTFEETFSLPARFKRMTKVTQNGKKSVLYYLVVDDDLWQWEEGGVAQKKKNDGKLMPHVAILAPLVQLTDGKIKLSPRPSIKVDGKRAVGFHASWENGGGEYYFDENTGRLLQTNSKIVPNPGMEFNTKVIFGDYKEFDGMQIPCRQTTYVKGGAVEDFSLLASVTITELRILEKLPDDAFALPKKE